MRRRDGRVTWFDVEFSCRFTPQLSKTGRFFLMINDPPWSRIPSRRISIHLFHGYLSDTATVSVDPDGPRGRKRANWKLLLIDPPRRQR